MSHSRWIKAGTAAAVLALAAAACGGGGKGTGSTSSGTTSGGSSFNAALTSVVNPSTKKGGTLNLVASSDFDSLDPGRTYYGYSWDFQRFITRTLMMYKAAPGKEGTQLVPDLATGPGQVSNGGKTWTYHLQTGVKFDTGQEITSQDIKYGVERLFATDVINGGPASYYQSLLVGGNSYPGPYKDKAGLASIKTPDAQTISFDLVKPFADFDYLMALPAAAPVPASKDTGKNYQFHPVSSGPYMIKTYQPGKLLDLVRNPYWSAATDPNRKALPDAVHLVEGLDPTVMDQQVLSGQAVANIDVGYLQPATVAQVLRSPTLKPNSDNPFTGYLRYLSVQTKVPPFNNIHCRRAVFYAVDKTALQFAEGGPVAGGAIATNTMVPTLPAYKQFDMYPDGPGNTGNIAMAKRELAECGKPNGFTTVLGASNKSRGPRDAQALQAALAKVGINATLALVDPSTYFSGFIGVPSNVQKRGIGLAVAGWGPDFPTEYGYYESIVDGRAIKAQGNSNYAELNDPVVNNLIDQALATTDAAARHAIWQQVDRQVMTDAVMVPLVAIKGLYYRNPAATNVYFNNAFGYYDYVSMGVK